MARNLVAIAAASTAGVLLASLYLAVGITFGSDRRTPAWATRPRPRDGTPFGHTDRHVNADATRS